VSKWDRTASRKVWTERIKRERTASRRGLDGEQQRLNSSWAVSGWDRTASRKVWTASRRGRISAGEAGQKCEEAGKQGEEAGSKEKRQESKEKRLYSKQKRQDSSR
jgi:hypothetical protein